MPWDAHQGSDDAAAASPLETLAKVGDALAAGPPAPEEELTIEERIEFAAAELKKATDKLEEEEDEAKKAALEKQRTKYIQEIKALEARVDASAVKAQAGGLSPAAPAFTPSKTAPPATAADGAAKADASAAAAAPAEPVPEPVTATFGKFKEQWATIGFKKEEIDEFIRGLQAIKWVELQEKLKARGNCRLIPEPMLQYLQTKWGKTFEIQAAMLPELLQDRPVQNVVFQQRAGTGKTVAFVINAIARCNPAWGHVQACIVSPTVLLNQQTAKVVEELAQGVQANAGVVADLARGTGIRVAAAIDRNDPAYSLQAPITAQILCATPGTLLGWCRATRGKKFIPNPEKIQVLIVDEADELIDSTGEGTAGKTMLELRDVLLRANPRIQFVLLSATFNDAVKRLANEFVSTSRNPTKQFYKPAEETIGKNVAEFAVRCRDEEEKLRAIEEILGGAKGVQTDMAVIFCQTKAQVKNVCRRLKEGAGLDASNIAECHSDLTQAERIKVVEECRRGEKNFLVSTDILAKGIDIDRCNVVVNYDLPIKHEQGVGITSSRSQPDFEKHLHRVGRAGRANKKGVAFHLVNEQEPWWKNHLMATMHHWADKELHWLWLDDDNFEDKVVEEQEKANPNLNEAESASAGQ